MTVKEYEQQISQYETEKDTLLSELDNKLTQMQPKFISYMQKKIKEIVESDIKNKSDITKSLTKEQLSEIKKVMNETIGLIETKLQIAFANNKFHTTITPTIDCMYEYNLAENARKYIISILESMLVPVDNVMQKYKYYYGKSYIKSLDIDINQEITLYAKICTKYLKLIIKLAECKEEKNKQEAEDLWNTI